MKYSKRGLYLLALLLSPLIVYAQLTQSVLSTYEQFYGWFDFIIYMLIFTGLAREFIELKAKKEHADVGPGGQALYLGLGLLLSASLVTWEVSQGYSLKDFGPLVIIILIAILLIRLYGYLKSGGKEGDGKGKFNGASLRSLSILLMIITAIIYLFFPGILLYYFWASWIGDLLVIIFVICFIYLIASSAFSFGGGGRGGGEGGIGGEGPAGEHSERGGSVSGGGLKDAAKAIGKWGTSPIWWPLKKLGQGAKYLGKELGIPGLKYVGREWLGEGGKALGRGVSKIPGGILKSGEYIAEKAGESKEKKQEQRRQQIQIRAANVRDSDLAIICLSKNKGNITGNSDIVIDPDGELLTFYGYIQGQPKLEEFMRSWKIDNIKRKEKEGTIQINTKEFSEGSHLVILNIIDKQTSIAKTADFRFNLVAPAIPPPPRVRPIIKNVNQKRFP